MSDAHVALIVEDDDLIAADLAEIVASIGHDSRIVSTLAGVRKAIEEGGYCYVLLDMEIPIDKGGRPLVSAGYTALRLLREAHPHRTELHYHVLPILVVSGFSRDPEFVSGVRDDANGFIAKPFADKLQAMCDSIQNCLRRAGRDKHAACVAVPAVAAAPVPVADHAKTSRVRLVLDGKRSGRRTSFLVSDERRDLQDSKFAVLLRLSAEQQRSPGVWIAQHALGVVERSDVPSKVSAVISRGMPKGFVAVQSDWNGSYRLHEDVIIERIDWEALASHPSPDVHKVVRDFGPKRSKV